MKIAQMCIIEQPIPIYRSACVLDMSYHQNLFLYFKNA